MRTRARGELSVLVNLTGASHTFVAPPDAAVLLHTGTPDASGLAERAEAALRHESPGAASFITLAPDSAAIVGPARP